MERNNQVAYIGIMVRSHRQGRWVLHNYNKYIPRNTKVFSFLPASINWTNKTVLGVHYTGRRYVMRRFPFPSVVYNRYYGAPESLIQRIEKTIGKNKCFNHVTHFDKQVVYDLLSQTALVEHLPQTLPYDDGQFFGLLEAYGTVYLKPCLGYKGKGVYRVELTTGNEVHVAEHHSAPMKICRDRALLKDEIRGLIGSKRYLVQQGISPMQVHGKNFDIRVLVQKTATGLWDVTDVMSRTAYSGYFNTSVCQSTEPGRDILREVLEPELAQTVLNSVCTISLETAQNLENLGHCHLGELSVDFVLDENAKPWIVEVNGDPQRTLYQGLPSHQSVYRNPMKYAWFLMQK